MEHKELRSNVVFANSFHQFSLMGNHGLSLNGRKQVDLFSKTYIFSQNNNNLLYPLLPDLKIVCNNQARYSHFIITSQLNMNIYDSEMPFDE